MVGSLRPFARTQVSSSAQKARAQAQQVAKRKYSLTKFLEKQIAREIAEAKRNGRHVRELSWLHEPTKEPKSNVVLLKSTKSANFKKYQKLFKAGEVPESAAKQLANEKKGSGILVKPPVDSETFTSGLHTHPNRTGVFTYEDVRAFLDDAKDNKKIKFEHAIAHNKKGKAIGLASMYYSGEKADIDRIMAEYAEAYAQMRVKNLKGFPNLAELDKFNEEFFRTHSLRQRRFARKGWVYNKKSGMFEREKS